MSVINQMLRDLDKQQQKSTPYQSAKADSATFVATQAVLARWLWPLLLLTILLALLVTLSQTQWAPGWLQQLLPKIGQGLVLPTPQNAVNQSVLTVTTPVTATPDPAALSPVATATAVSETRAQPSTDLLAATAAKTLVDPVEVIAPQPSVMAQGAATQPGTKQHQVTSNQATATLVPNAVIEPATPVSAATISAELAPVLKPKNNAVAVTEITAELAEAPQQSTATAPMAVESVLQITAQSEPTQNIVTQPYQGTALTTERAVPSITVATEPAQMSVQRVDSTELSLQRWLLQAQQAQQQGQWQNAATAWLQYIRLAPQQLLGYQQLGQLLLQQQRWSELAQLLQQAQQQGLQHPTLSLLQLKLLATEQNWPMLLQQLDESLEQQYPAEALALKANAQTQLKQWAAALQSYQQWLKAEPGQARAWLGQALVYEQLAQRRQAAAAYRQALVLGGLAPASSQYIQQRLAVLTE